jgi:Flp pilus assembly pilin Flp
MFTLLMKRLNRTERGANFVEYVLLVGVAILVAAAAAYKV